MMAGHMEAAAAFAVTLPALLVAHTVADHWVQTGHQAATKGERDWPGRVACAAHVATYTAATAAAVLAVWAVFGLAISPAGFVAGQLVSAVTHYWADRRHTLEWLARAAGKAELYALGAPRPIGLFVVDPTVPDDQVGDLLEVLHYEVDEMFEPVRTPDGGVIPLPYDNKSIGTGAYALDQSWHWLWLFAAALLTATVGAA